VYKCQGRVYVDCYVCTCVTLGVYGDRYNVCRCHWRVYVDRCNVCSCVSVLFVLPALMRAHVLLCVYVGRYNECVHIITLCLCRPL
jgi:predicted ATPase